MCKSFCGFCKTTSTTSEGLFKIVKEMLFKFQLPIDKCRGHCYDDAANVSGRVNGLRMKLIHEESRAICVHKRVHKLNSGCFKNSNDVRYVMRLVQSPIAIIRGPPKRLSWFYQFQAVQVNHQLASLRALCPTLWIMRLISLEAISRNYTPIILWLQEVDQQVRTDPGVKAGGFLPTIRKSNTYFYINVLRMVLSLLKALVHSCRMLSLIFANPRMFLLAQKLLSLAQRMMPDLTAYGVEF